MVRIRSIICKEVWEVEIVGKCFWKFGGDCFWGCFVDCDGMYLFEILGRGLFFVDVCEVVFLIVVNFGCI